MLVRKVSRYRIQAVYSSDLQRAYATAKAVARRFDTDVIVRPPLREIHLGRWEGLSWRQIARQFPRLSRMWLTRFPHHPIPGAERFHTFKKRVTRELDEIVTANIGSSVAIVTHAGVARVILAGALAVPDRNVFRMRMDPSAVSVIDFYRDGAIVQCINS